MRLQKSALILALSLAGCAGDGSKRSEPPWRASMRALSGTLAGLMPILADGAPLTPAKRAETIRLARELDRVSHDVSRETRGFGADPSVRMVSKEFGSGADRAVALLEKGDWEGARRQLRRSTQYCIGCHTLRPGPGKPLGDVKVQPEFSALTHSQQGEFYASVREFDEAIIQFEYALVDRDRAHRQPEDWARDFQKLLAIAVRVKKNPGLGLELVSRFADAASYPDILGASARIWRRQLSDWREAERIKPENILDEKARFALALGLVEKAEATLKGRDALLLHLRASSLLHELLWTKSGTGANLTDESAKVAYYSGLSAEKLSEMSFWTLPEDYYRLCEEAGQGNSWSQKCAARRKSLEGTGTSAFR